MDRVAHEQSQQQQIEEARDVVTEQQEMFFDEFEEEDVGTSPINLPDPSVFSDLGENGAHADQHMPPQNAKDHYNLEEENEKRELEQIYLVAGKDRKSTISVIELYGFFSWNLSTVCFIIYMIWAFVPENVLNDFGIYQVPDRYYAIALPLWLCATVLFALQLYVSVCMWSTPNIESYETLQDKHTILKNPTYQHPMPDTAEHSQNLDDTRFDDLSTPQTLDDMRSLNRQQSHQVPLRAAQSQ